MASARFAWGIDIGNRALKAIKLVHGDNGLRIDEFEVIEHENVLSSAGDNKEALIQASLNNFVARHPGKGGIAAISVSGVSSFARFIKLPPVEAKKIPEIVRFEAIQQIPFPLDDVEWSYQLFQNEGSPEVEVGIFAMRRDLINQYIQHFTNVDLNVQVVQMNPLAVYNAMYHDNRIQGTTMIIDLGAENTDLIIAEGDGVWLRSIPIGGNNFTEVLVKSFKLPFGKAEELKRNANTSKYARQIFQAMRPVFADLVAEIQRSIGFYASVHRDSRIKKVIALGGTFRLAGLQKYLQQNLQLDVSKLHDLAAGAPTDPKLATAFNENLLSLASAYGLAIQAMGQAKITSSLLPMRIRRERMWQEKTKWFGAAAAAFVLGTGLAAGGAYLQGLRYDQEQSTRDTINSVLSQAQSLDGQWRSQVESAGAPDRQKISNVRSMFDGRELWPAIFTDMLSALPPTQPLKVLMSKPRDQREVILVDKYSSLYAPDLSKALMSGSLGPSLPIIPNDPAIPAGSRGFVVTMNVTTPHHDGYPYVLDTLVKNLSAMNLAAMNQYNTANPSTPKNYYVVKAFTPVEQKQVHDDPIRVQELSTSYSAATGTPGVNTPAVAVAPNNGDEDTDPRSSRLPPVPVVQQPQPGAAQTPTGPNPAYIDRLTGEDRENDWEMKVVFVVVIAPPQGAAAAQPSAASEGN
jgi:type IV pilus assembly protein PilM